MINQHRLGAASRCCVSFSSKLKGEETATVQLCSTKAKRLHLINEKKKSHSCLYKSLIHYRLAAFCLLQKVSVKVCSVLTWNHAALQHLLVLSHFSQHIEASLLSCVLLFMEIKQSQPGAMQIFIPTDTKRFVFQLFYMCFLTALQWRQTESQTSRQTDVITDLKSVLAPALKSLTRA